MRVSRSDQESGLSPDYGPETLPGALLILEQNRNNFFESVDGMAAWPSANRRLGAQGAAQSYLMSMYNVIGVTLRDRTPEMNPATQLISVLDEDVIAQINCYNNLAGKEVMKPWSEEERSQLLGKVRSRMARDGDLRTTTEWLCRGYQMMLSQYCERIQANVNSSRRGGFYHLGKKLGKIAQGAAFAGTGLALYAVTKHQIQKNK